MSYADAVLPILRRTRDLSLPHWGAVDVVHEKSAGDALDVVTELDLAIERFAKEELAKLFPSIAFVGEEFGGDREASHKWIMDPIDGTGHFIRGLPFSTTMIALVEEGEITFSAIYDFVSDRMYWAEKGRGAFCNTEKIQVSNRRLSQSYLCWETHINSEENRRVLHQLFEKAVTFKGLVAGWEFAMIASGKLDGRVTFDPHGKDYDFAPGAFLVKEAGGKVANIGSDAYDYRNLNFIAANPVIFDELTAGPDALFPIKRG